MKTLGKIALLLIILPVLALLALVLLVDANRFKPHIEKIAQDQGVALQINGDLGWSFWPSIGVQVNQLSVAPLATPEQPLAQLAKASLLLKLRPLLSGSFQVDHLLLDGAVIDLRVDDSGQGNWSAFTQADAAPKPNPSPGAQSPSPATGTGTAPANPAEAPSSDAESLSLAIEQISITSAQVSYRDAASGQLLVLKDLALQLEKVNTQAQAFPLSLSFSLEQADMPPLALSLNNRVALNPELTQVTLSDGQLQLSLGDADPVSLSYQLALKDLTTDLSYQGQFALEETNARALLAALGTELETANPDALKKLSLSAALAGDSTQVRLNDLMLRLDSTRLQGVLAVTDFATSALALELKGDKINVDDYLPPPSATQASGAPASTEDTPLPLEALRSLNLSAKLSFEQMIIKQITMNQVVLAVKAKNGLLSQDLDAQAYKGAIAFNSKTDARGAQAAMTFDGGVQGLELAPLLKDMELDEKFSLTGAIQAKAQGGTRGGTVNQLLAAMDSTAQFSGAQVRLAPLNIEEQFCKLVNLVTQNPAEVSWDAFTEMRQLDGNLLWRDQVIRLNSLNAGVSQLLLASTGQINLATDKYEFKLPVKIASASEAAKLKGCSLGETNYWVDRGLSLLRCKGSLNALDPLKDCGFDKSALGSLTKDFAEYKLREKHGAKIEAAEQKVEQKKEEAKAKVEEKKQELMNKLQNKLFKTPAAETPPAESTSSEPAAP